MSDSRRVLITGADGTIGRILRERLAGTYRLSFLTRRPAAFASHVGSIERLDEIEGAFKGVDTVVHLAGESSVDAPWERVLPANIVGAYNVFEAARRAGVRRVVFASSNHAIGMYEAEGAPAIYELDDRRTYAADVPARPDSLYGASKVFGEALGRMYADRHAMEVICLRIGAVRADDDPTNAHAGRPFEPLPPLSLEDARRRLRAVWLSHRDCVALVQAAVEADVSWAVVYGTSDNPRQMWDLGGARELLGYRPSDSAPA